MQFRYILLELNQENIVIIQVYLAFIMHKLKILIYLYFLNDWYYITQDSFYYFI